MWKIALVIATTSSLLFVGSAAMAHARERILIADGFEIDRTEVTIAEFRVYAEVKRLHTRAEVDGGGSEYGAGWERRPGWTVYRPFGEEPSSDDGPAVHVSWEEARGYCTWRGGRLPSAGEWRHAAYLESRVDPGSGFEVGRTYPYSSGLEPDGLNTNGEDSWPRHAPAGSTPPGINGLNEMGGNVWEWLADRKGEAALTAGGSWWYGPEQTTAAVFQWKPAVFFAVYVGLRCVYDPS